MGKAIPLTIGNELFLKKSEVEERIHTLMKKYEINSFLVQIDEAFCLNLIKFHPNYTAKFGVGIRGVQVRLDSQGNKYFHLHRIDGSDDDISWVKCLRAARTN